MLDVDRRRDVERAHQDRSPLSSHVQAEPLLDHCYRLLRATRLALRAFGASMTATLPTEPRSRSTDTFAIRAVIAADRAIYRFARHWLLAVNVLALPFALLPLVAPVLRAAGSEALAAPTYAFFGAICHQRDDRSFHAYGEKLACCQRCFAIYGGVFALGLLFCCLRASLPDLRPLRPRWAALLCAPLAIDMLLQFAGVWDSNPFARAVTGLLFAVAVSWFLLPFLERGFAQMRHDLERRFARLVAQGRAGPLPGAPLPPAAGD